ncbi:MAG TPA: hypothetical protein VIW68_11385 [Candidatus Sulfotelmatobacter sp.]
MRAGRQKSLTMTEGAVSETLLRVHAKALALLKRRREINRRIRCLHHVVQGLQELATNTAANAGWVSTAAAEHNAGIPNAVEPSGEREFHNGTPTREHSARRSRSQLRGRLSHQLAGLSRACRIALMEVGSASTDEILSRIDRRGSFTFSESECPHIQITRSLGVMYESGEIQCFRSGLQVLWQRISPADEGNLER